MPIKFTHEQAVKKLAEGGFDILETYINAFTKVLMMCRNCNSTKSIKPILVFQGNTTSCGCKANLTKSLSHRWTGYGEINGEYWGDLLRNAKSRNIEVKITIKDAWNLYRVQKGKCYLTGEDIPFRDTHRGFDIASLDRVDSSLGYIPGNLIWIRKEVNRMKIDFSLSRVIYLAHLVTNPIEIVNDLGLDVNSSKHRGRWMGYGTITGKWFNRFKSNAINRNIAFNVTIEEIWSLYQKQQGCCHITGLPIFFKKGVVHILHPDTASLDRIDNTKDYSLSNIMITHKDINVMRNKYHLDQFKIWMKKISDRNL